jgi:putative transposase
MIQTTHKIELNPNNEQKTYFTKACGVRRFAYNWALGEWNRLYEENKNLPKENKVKISGLSLKKSFNAIKKEKFPWTKEVTKYAAQEPFLDLDNAFKRFFKKKSKRPKFKKKNKSKDSFYVGGDQLKLEGQKVWVPNLGFVRMKESLRFEGKLNSATFSRQGNKWFASLQMSIAPLPPQTAQRVIGVDLGLNSLAVTSDGYVFENPKPLKDALKKLRREQRKFSRQVRQAKKEKRELSKSKNVQKQKKKVAQIHYKVSCKRQDTLHKITSFLCSHYKSIALEDLNVTGMLKNHKLAKHIQDAGWGELRRQVKYKAKRKGIGLVIVDRFFASSKTCNRCKKVKESLSLKERTFYCDHCGFKADRDYNAALNLRDEIGIVCAELTPVEITALLQEVNPLVVTSIREAGSEHQTLYR